MGHMTRENETDKISVALLGVLGNRGIMPLISGEQWNKNLKLTGTGEQRQLGGTGNIENQNFDFGEQGKMPILFQGSKGTGTPSTLGGPHKCQNDIKII